MRRWGIVLRGQGVGFCMGSLFVCDGKHDVNAGVGEKALGAALGHYTGCHWRR
jgi:hypothetical protein